MKYSSTSPSNRPPRGINPQPDNSDKLLNGWVAHYPRKSAMMGAMLPGNQPAAPPPPQGTGPGLPAQPPMMPGTGQTNSLIGPANAPLRFFKVLIEQP